ncbi:replication protein P [Pseudomonas solani]|uniref:replication protein P n=1 Tax=Pseudomonas solani TaxID=2731552 RepID=UPI003D6ADE29
METAKTIAASVLNRPSTESKPQSPPEKLAQPLLDKLWIKLTELYGNRWTGSFGVSADQSHAWAATLGGLTGAQIGFGLTVLSTTQDEQLRKWPPSAPEFRALCENNTAEAHGLPTPDQAYREATRNAHPHMAGIATWSHEVVYHAATETGFYNLNTLAMRDSRKLFDRNYAIAIRDFLDGKPLKAMPLALPERVDARRTPEVGRAALQNLRSNLRGAAK